MVPVLRVAPGAVLLFAATVAIWATGGCAESANLAGDDASADDSAGEAQVPEIDGGACRPGDVETYRPSGYTSATAPGQGVCLMGMFGFDAVQGFYEACLGPVASGMRCAAFKADPMTAACAHCILTPDTDQHYGPLIDHGGVISPNVAGCIELTDQSGLSCAQAVQALGGCEQAACGANCPVRDTATRAAYDACVAQADVSGCLSYSKQAVCAAGESDGGAAAICLATAFVDFYNAVVPLFCGQAPAREGGAPVFDASRERDSDANPIEDAALGQDAPMDVSIRPPFDARGDVVFDAVFDSAADVRPE